MPFRTVRRPKSFDVRAGVFYDVNDMGASPTLTQLALLYVFITFFSATGPALREKIYTMQNLYQKYKQTGLEEAETNNLLQIRKLLQLKTLVTTLLDDSR